MRSLVIANVAFSMELLLLLVPSDELGVVGIMVRFPLISLGESVRVSTVLHMPEVGVLVILVLEMALVLLLEDIVVLVCLSEFLTKGGLMLIGGLRLDRDHLCRTVVLSGVQRLWNIRLHLQH